GKRSAPRAEADAYCDRFKRQPQSRVWFFFFTGCEGESCHHPEDKQHNPDSFYIFHNCISFGFGFPARRVKAFPQRSYRTKVLPSRWQRAVKTFCCSRLSAEAAAIGARGVAGNCSTLGCPEGIPHGSRSQGEGLYQLTVSMCSIAAATEEAR